MLWRLQNKRGLLEQAEQKTRAGTPPFDRIRSTDKGKAMFLQRIRQKLTALDAVFELAGHHQAQLEAAIRGMNAEDRAALATAVSLGGNHPFLDLLRSLITDPRKQAAAVRFAMTFVAMVD